MCDIDVYVICNIIFSTSGLLFMATEAPKMLCYYIPVMSSLCTACDVTIILWGILFNVLTETSHLDVYCCLKSMFYGLYYITEFKGF